MEITELPEEVKEEDVDGIDVGTNEEPAPRFDGWLGVIDRYIPLTWETALVAVLLAVGLFTRLFILGARVTSHDESLHTYYSYLLATGHGFKHMAMMHGPSLFEITAIIDAILGASDFTSRLGPALAGLFVAIFIPQLFKRWIGRTAALVTTVLLIISPYVTYFSRYIRHDMLLIAFELIAVFAVFRYLESRHTDYLYLLAIALAFMVSTMEVAFFFMAILAVFLIGRLLLQPTPEGERLRQRAEVDLLAVVVTLGGLFSSQIFLVGLNPIWTRLSGAAFVNVKVFDTQGYEWATGPDALRIWLLFGSVAAGCTLIGLVWNWKRWIPLAALFAFISAALYTTFFTNLQGLGTGFVGSLGYWLSQQGVARGDQPWYYYLIVWPLYEYLPLVGGLIAIPYFIIRRRRLPEWMRQFIPFMILWGGLILVGLSLAGEKMPWLSTHITIPFIFLAGWWLGQMIEGLFAWNDEAGQRVLRLPQLGSLAVFGVLALLTVRSMVMVNYIDYDYTTEYIDYAHGAPGVKWILQDIQALAAKTSEGKNIKIAYDDEVAWPMTWYMRLFPGQVFFGSTPTRSNTDAAVVIAGPKNWAKVEALLGPRYTRYELIRMWWPVQDYMNLTPQRIGYALTNADMRAAIWQIIWNRDYTAYAALTNQKMDAPKDWPLEESLRVYIRKDLADEVAGLQVKPYQLETPPPSVTYAGLDKPVTSLKLASPNLNGARGLAVAPDGSVYLADTGDSLILHLDASGALLNTLGSRSPDGVRPVPTGTFNEPWGVAVDSQGNLYVADTWNHRIQKFDPKGQFLMQFGQAGELAEGPDRFWGPRDVAVGSDGRIYVTDTGNKRVAVFDASGKFLFDFKSYTTTAGLVDLDEPVGLAFGPDGNLYVADTWNGRIAVFDPDGKPVRSWVVDAWPGASLDNKPYITVDGQGRVFITDPEAYRVIAFDSFGKALGVYGSYGEEPNNFAMPAGIGAAPDGTLWISDAINNRLGAYTLP